MMANNDMSRWCVLYTAPKSERKLVQRLHAAGYMAFCPMQIVFKKWKGQTKEVFAPLFPDCVFVEEAAGVELFICLLYTSPSPRDVEESRMPSSA